MEGKSILSETINALERERVEFYRQLKETQTQIRIVDHKIRALKETEIILNGGSVTVSTGTMFLGDAVEEILKAEGQPLHLEKILAQLRHYNLFPTIKVLSSTLSEDVRGRFSKLETRVFGLNPNGKRLHTPKDRKRILKGLTSAIRDALRGKMTDEFTFSDLLPIIEKQNPKIGARLRENRASLSAVLKTMSKTGELEVARNGFGSLPNIYRVKALRVEEEE